MLTPRRSKVHEPRDVRMKLPQFGSSLSAVGVPFFFLVTTIFSFSFFGRDADAMLIACASAESRKDPLMLLTRRPREYFATVFKRL